jgi:hypothetical protein
MSQRKAWNEAMRSAAGGVPLIPGQERRTTSRAKRREKARRSISSSHTSSSDVVAFRLDALEEVNEVENEEGQGEEEYDELEDVEEKTAKKKRKSSSKKTKKGSGLAQKRFKPRSLASILMEESGRDDGIVQQYLQAEARPKSNGQQRLPRRKFCPVTGLEGIYTDPKSGISYANLEALEQLRERLPPWLTGFSGGSAAYHDTIKSLRNEE